MTPHPAPRRSPPATAQPLGTCLALGMWALLFASPSWAIYQCTTNGHTSFQDFPCAKNASQAREIMVSPPLGDATATDAAPAPSPPPPASSEKMHQQNRLRDLDNSLIPQARQRIQRASSQCNARIESARNQKAFPEDKHTASSANQPLRNLALATRDQAISAEMQAIATQCATEQQRLQADLDRLLSEKNTLEAALRS